MSDELDLSTFRKKLEERRAREAAAAAASAPAEEFKFDDDLVPDLEGVSTSPASNPDMDRAIESIGIIDAYRQWCGKSSPSRADARTEGIKVSCPIPSHPDRDPSAWLNTEKNTWYCGSCGVGGDAYDIAAYHFGFPVPGYKEGAQFHELREKMAQSFGYTFVKAPGLDKPLIVPPEPELPETMRRKVDFDTSPEPEAKVIPISDEVDDAPMPLPTFDWRKIVPAGTFLHTYMKQCTLDDAPEEYHFWNGMLAIGFALGRDVTLWDTQPVHGNLFLCLLGPTGDGKSRSFAHLRRLLYTALPHKWDDPNSYGTQFVSSPASAEVLIHSFSKPVIDETNPKRVAYYAPVRGLIEFNELSSLVGRAARKGNVLKPTLMEFYDCSPVVETGSMTHGVKHAEMPFASVFTTTQPLALKELVRETDAHSGFLNRWVFASGTPKKRIAIGGAQIDISPAVGPLKEIVGWTGRGKQVQWSDAAAKCFTEFFDTALHPAQLQDQTGLLTRVDLLAKKLILLLCANAKSDEVTVGIVECVKAMFSYLTAAYGVPAAHIGSTVASEVRDEIMRHVTRYTEKKGGISLRDLNKCLKRKNFPLDVISKTLKHLTDLGFIEVFTTTGVGRPTVKYKVAS